MFQIASGEFWGHFQNSRQEYGKPQNMSSSRQILKPVLIIETGNCSPQKWILKWKHNKCRNANNNCDPKWTCLVSIERFQGQFLLSISLPGFYTFLSLPQQSFNILTLRPHFYFCKLWYNNIAVKRFGACENKSLSERENVKKTICLLFLFAIHNVPSRVQALYHVIDFLRHFVPDTINYGRFYRVLRLSVWRYSTCRSLFSESAQFIFLSSQKPDVHPYIRGTAWHGYDDFILTTTSITRTRIMARVIRWLKWQWHWQTWQ